MSRANARPRIPFPQEKSTLQSTSSHRGALASSGVHCSDELDQLEQLPLEWADDEAQAAGADGFRPPPPTWATSTPTGSFRQSLRRATQVSSVIFPSRSAQQPSVAVQHSSVSEEIEQSSQMRAPVRLDKRRLDKAVSLAIEAAQVSEQDGRAWRRRSQRQRRTQSTISLFDSHQGHIAEGSRREKYRTVALSKASPPPDVGHNTRFGRFRSLGWKRTSLDLESPSTPSESGWSEDKHAGAVVPYDARRSTASKAPFILTETQSSSLEDDTEPSSEDLLCGDSDDTLDEASSANDGFSIDLYISSLGYLLGALKPEDASAVRDGQRKELIGKLREALRKLEPLNSSVADQSGGQAHADEDLMIARIHQKLASLEQNEKADLRAYPPSDSTISDSTRVAKTAPLPGSLASGDSAKNSLTGYLASSALDFGLSVGAGMIAAAARGVAVLVPVVNENRSSREKSSTESSSATVRSPSPSGEIVDIRRSTTTSVSRNAHSASLQRTGSNEGARSTRIHPPRQTAGIMSGPQWDLARGLAGSIGASLYQNLAAVAEQHREVSPESRALARATVPCQAVSGLEAEACPCPRCMERRREIPEDATDRLVVMSATLARSVKRSPLPNQLRTLGWQAISLAAALDRRYSLSKRTVDVALRKAGQALTFVRKRDLHVKAVRISWALVEAGVVAIEAYRDEEGWPEDGGDLILSDRQIRQR